MTDMTNQEIEVDATGNESTTVDTQANDVVQTSADEDQSLTTRQVVENAFDKLAAKEGSTALDTPAKEKTPVVLTQAEATAKSEEGTDPVTGRKLEQIHAPASLSPTLREKWGSVDRSLQQYIVDRDKHINRVLQDTAEERKVAQEFRKTVAPYEKVLQQYNIHAPTLVGKLLEMNHALALGSGEQKAQIIFQLINEYQPDSTALQQLFSGTRHPTSPLTSAASQDRPIDIDEEVNRRIAEREANAHSTSLDAEIQAFAADPRNEFFNDVREMMGNAITGGFVTGSTNAELLANAYAFATQHHPEVKSVLSSRAAAVPSVQAPAQPAAAKPVGSVKPSLGSNQRSKAPDRKLSVREAAEQAWAQLGGE